MGKSQTKRLREATRRFGREDRSRWIDARANLAALIHIRKAEAGLVSPVATAMGSAYNGQAIIKRSSTCLSYQQNELIYGKSLK